MTTITTQEIPVHRIIDNPFQPRTVYAPEALQALADNIKQYGLQHVPEARKAGRTAKGDFYELKFGHRRFRAWQMAFPDQPMPLVIVEATDEEMFQHAIIENVHEPLTAIEQAAAINEYITKFNATQLQAGVLFGIKSQGAVSNLLNLLKLPASVQTMLKNNELAQRHARALVPLMAYDVKFVESLAKKLIKQDEGDRDETMNDAIRRECWNKGKRLHAKEFPLDYPKTAFMVSEGTKAQQQIIACTSCPFHIRSQGGDFCLNKKCHDIKKSTWAIDEAERVSKALGIAVLTAIEQKTAEIVFSGAYEDDRRKQIVKLLKDKALKPDLRIAPATDERMPDYGRADVLGSDVVMLVTVNPNAVKKALKIERAVAPKKPVNDYAAQERARVERSKQCKEIIISAAPHFAPKMPTDADVLALLIKGLNYSGMSKEDRDKKLKEARSLGDRQALVAQLVLLATISHNQWDSTATPTNVTKQLTTLAQSLKVKLPKLDTESAAPAPVASAKKGKK